MYCMDCGQRVQVDAAFCPHCGGAQSAGSAGLARGRLARAGSGHGGTRHTVSLSFDAARWGRGEIVVGVATLVLFIALFLPWFGLDVGGVNLGATGIPGLSLNALDADGWMYITLLVALALMAYLLLSATLEELSLPVSRWQALAGATGLNLLLTVIAFAAIPGGASFDGISAYSYSWSYGAFVGLLAALAAVGGTALYRRESGGMLQIGSTSAPATAGSTVSAATAQRGVPNASQSSKTTAGESAAASPTPARSVEASQQESATCPACGGLIPADSRFCRRCGGSLGDALGAGETSA